MRTAEAAVEACVKTEEPAAVATPQPDFTPRPLFTQRICRHQVFPITMTEQSALLLRKQLAGKVKSRAEAEVEAAAGG